MPFFDVGLAEPLLTIEYGWVTAHKKQSGALRQGRRNSIANALEPHFFGTKQERDDKTDSLLLASHCQLCTPWV